MKSSKKRSILIVGSGSREHAIAWKISESPLIKKTFVYPGNPAMAYEDAITQVINETEVEDNLFIIDFCQKSQIDLVVIGPEKYLCAGLYDQLVKNNIHCIGPDKACSLLEKSKIFSKKLMLESNILTAEFVTFTDPKLAREFIGKGDRENFVIKEDGLASGKGVYVASSKLKATLAIDEIEEKYHLSNKEFVILIEERLIGKEVSLFALCDGEDFIPLGMACDYKRLMDHDQGPNTGGMGAYGPVHWIDKNTENMLYQQFIKKILSGLKVKGFHYQGFLFAGLMKSSDQFYALEYNVRLGDPETQVLMPRIKSDIVPFLLYVSGIDRTHKLPEMEFYDTSCVHVVKVSKGYAQTGQELELEKHIDLSKVEKNNNNFKLPKIFYSGVKEVDGQLQTSGGRVLGVSATGKDFSTAREMAYKTINQIGIEGSYCRSDIGL